MKTKLLAAITIVLFMNTSVAQTTDLKKLRFQKLGLTLNDWADAQIHFWKKIYTETDSDHALIHDSANLVHVYRVVEATPTKIANAKKEVRALLESIYQKNKNRKSIESESLTDDERKLFEALEANEDPRAYQFAADPDRVRAQLGQKDQLANAFSISKRYLPRMEEMFTEEGVPIELTRLPFVESAFLSEAKSKVGATGIWQFMPQTAAKNLRVTAAIDERYDPLKSTRAAARFLKSNYKILKSWPLAVMAYHHGPGLVQKAMSRLKTSDPIRILKTFKHASFQFASRNYLFEFLAMLDVNATHELFFENVETAKLPDFITVSLPHAVTMKTLINHYHLAETQMKILNPHFLDPIWKGSAWIPAHYPIRMTGITLEEFRKVEYPKTQ